MRLKVRCIYNRNLKDIWVQNVKYCYSLESPHDPPVVYFDVPKKYEGLLKYDELIFYDKKKGEHFRATKIQMDYRYYEESWRSRKPKVRFKASGLEVMHLGKVSGKYVGNVLKNCCNARVKVDIPDEYISRHPLKKTRPLSRYGPGVLRLMGAAIKHKCCCEFYRNYVTFSRKRLRFIIRYFRSPLVNFNIISDAPP